MITFILWFWNIISPVILFFGLGYIADGGMDEITLILCGITAIPGFILGLVGWKHTVPPRWFWVKSRVESLNNLIVCSFGYALQFAFIPPAIFFILDLFA